MAGTMTAIAIEGGKGAAEALKPVEVQRPEAGAGQILIKVAAAGVNRPDVMQRMGVYPMPPGVTAVPGLEIAGEVVALGEGHENDLPEAQRLGQHGRYRLVLFTRS